MVNFSDKTIGKLVTLAALAIGIAIGFLGGVAYHPQQEVQAQAINPHAPAVQEVSPGVTTGTFGANLILVHEIDADHLVVNGFDLMQMQQNVLNYLATRPLAERADIENIINASRASTVYRFKQSPVPAPATTTPAVPEKK
jgi:hypothetical protein